MRFLYDIFFIIFAIFYLPYFLIKGKYHMDFLERFGIFDRDRFSQIAPARPIWLHAVSVGEMKTAENFIKKIQDLFPSKRFVISNTTETGHKIALSVARRDDVIIYFPVDLTFVVKRLVRLVNPSLFISIETEIWPNLISELAARKIPVVLMNGRISQASYNNYRFIKPIMGAILGKTTLLCMRTKQDAERIKRLGASAGRIKISGNMKFDSVAIEGEKENDVWPPLKNKDLWLPDISKLIIAASTHRGEDGKILKAYKALKKNHPHLVLLIAPRHIERVDEISSLVEQSGFKAVRIKEVEERCEGAVGKAEPFYGKDSVFILDSIGRLSSLYKLATVVFMGGSLVPHGGHNFIEPAAYAKPIVTGPHVHNFEDICELFAINNAIEIVNDDNELINSLQNLLDDEDRRRVMGEKARKVVFENVGSTDRNIQLIRQFL